MMEQRRQDAKEFIDEVRTTNGGATKEDIEFLEKNKPKFLKSFFSLQDQLAASTKILSDELYTKDTRFVYELIQNAEDNQYLVTVTPCLSFTLRQKCIIIDSNEEGFTKRDIDAICRVGKSTKTFQQGYIGEKGIGFKSVFKVACKVHVQSEPYSFAFEYEKGDQRKSLGMVTPLNEEYLPVPNGVQTRIILYLDEDCDRPQLRKDFLSLPDTLLLFLKKLKKLSVNIELPDYPQQHISYFLRSNDPSYGSNRTVIEKHVEDSVSKQTFFIKKRQVNDMPTHPARKEIHNAEVVLAFPLDSEVPVIEDQLIFAFLPMRKEKYKFLIQSDFITAANREDVTSCPWNDRLLKEVTKTFLHAIEDDDGFLQHPKIKYSWVRYIPVTRITHDFWKGLQTSLISELSARRLFFSHNESHFWKPDQLRVVTDKFREPPNLEPLVADLASQEIAYISERYNTQLDLPVMKKLGTTDLSLCPDFLNRLKQDLNNVDYESRWKSEDSSDDDWQTIISSLLMEALKIPEQKDFVRKLEIVPLLGGKWVCALNASIFFPSCGGVDIPSNLDLSLVDDQALQNESRKTLFINLGITECASTRIFPLIEQRYAKGGTISTCYFFQDIEFLFWHNDKVPTRGYSIYLTANNGKGYHYEKTTGGCWSYCPESRHPYSMFNLVSGKVPKSLEEKIKYPRIGYYDTLKECGLRNNIAGTDWLRSRADIKVTPQLRRRNCASAFGKSQPEMSDELLYIAENLPEYLLGVLESEWTEYHKSPEWDAKLIATKVPILDCAELRELRTTFLPLPKLKAIVKELDLAESFGFLKELDGMVDIEYGKWEFLKRFGVGMENDVSFWLALLKQVQKKEGIEKHHVFKIYSNLQKFTEEEDVKALQEAFEDDLLYIPEDTSSTSWGWTDRGSCIWSGPEWFSYHRCLQSISEYQPLYGLLVTTLGLQDVTLTDFLDNLEYIKYLDSNEEKLKIPLLYQSLNELAKADTSGTAKNNIRTQIEETELVYSPITQSWHPPSSCIWAEDHTQLPGKLSIATLYKAHGTFFRQVLDVKKPSVEMHILALVQKASDSPDKQNILQEMRNICALDPKPDILWTRLSGCACFPVRKPSGEINWLSCSDSFAIVDRTEYGNIFRDKIMTLDMSLEEVHSLKSFFLGLRLESKYLSNAVTEETRVEGGLLNSVQTDDLRRKAYAISRYAAHLGAPDPITTYSLLQNVEVFSSDSISKVVSITLNGAPIEVSGETAYFHIQEDGNQLRLYIPKSKRDQQVCLARQLPIKLLKHLGIQYPGKGAELGAIITASSLFVVDAILQQDGIIEVAGIETPEDDAEDDIATLSDMSPSGSIATITYERSPSTERSSRSSPERYWQPRNIDVSDDPFLTPATSVSPRPSTPLEQPDLYKELIDIVIHQAESVPGLPAIGASVLASVASNSTLDRCLAVRSSVPREEWRKIGAVGELFMFEFLKNKLSLPGFDLNHWQSQIRDRVAVDSRYNELAPWSEPETADIVYPDDESAFTKHLIQQGYLKNDSWAGRNPTYYIEVKTTMHTLDTPFFCSQNQFNRMEKTKLPDLGPSSEVYLIARVFGVGGSRMGLHLYVDPARLIREGKLKFVAEKYTVTQIRTRGTALG